jgi:hypothetical protein
MVARAADWARRRDVPTDTTMMLSTAAAPAVRPAGVDLN